MKCLTLTQPYATLIALGCKKIETRSWSTAYRGELAIHAAKGFPKAARALCGQSPFREALDPSWTEADILVPFDWFSHLPRGAVVATCTLVHVFPIAPLPIPAWHFHGGEWVDVPPEKDSAEYAFGDYKPGRWAWILSEIRPLASPVPARGALGLWEWNSR